MEASTHVPQIRVLTKETATQSVYPLEEGRISIGRSTENRIILQDSLVSRRHAELEFDGESVVIKNCLPRWRGLREFSDFRTSVDAAFVSLVLPEVVGPFAVHLEDRKFILSCEKSDSFRFGRRESCPPARRTVRLRER